MTYPEQPGWKGTATSRAAAEGVKPAEASLRARVYDAIKARPGTPEEIAERLGEPVMNIRPRCSQLKSMGVIQDSGARAKAMGGRQAIVWEIVRFDPW